MYVCVCRGITDQQLKEAVGLRNGNIREICKRLGLGTDCGTCLAEALEIINNDLKIASHHDEKITIKK